MQKLVQAWARRIEVAVEKAMQQHNEAAIEAPVAQVVQEMKSAVMSAKDPYTAGTLAKWAAEIEWLIGNMDGAALVCELADVTATMHDWEPDTSEREC